jgi:hypothetical protein
MPFLDARADSLTGDPEARGPQNITLDSLDDRWQPQSFLSWALGINNRADMAFANPATRSLIGAEDFVWGMLANPGAGRLGMARVRGPTPPRPSDWLETIPAQTRGALQLPGRGYQPPPADDVLGLVQRLGLPVHDVRRGDGGTTYIRLRVPENRTGLITIRVPRDAHAGQPRSAAQEGGNYFDLGTELGRSFRGSRAEVGRIRNVTENAGGGQYAVMDNLEGALRWRFFGHTPETTGRLVPPEMAPLPSRYGTQGPQPPPATADPNQPRLLGVLPPVAAAGMDPMDDSLTGSRLRDPGVLEGFFARMGIDTRLGSDALR